MCNIFILLSFLILIYVFLFMSSVHLSTIFSISLLYLNIAALINVIVYYTWPL